jgi:hypothetical protein
MQELPTGVKSITSKATNSNDESPRWYDTPRETAGDEKEATHSKKIHRDAAAMGRLVLHTTEGKFSEDMNLVATGGERLMYVDMFPVAQVAMQYRSASAYELAGPLIDLAIFVYQKLGFVIPTVVLCMNLSHISDESDKKRGHILHEQEEALQELIAGKAVAGLLTKYGGFDHATAFLVEGVLFVADALLLVVLMSCGIYRRLEKRESRLKKSEEYIEEIATCLQEKKRKLQPMHRRVHRVEVWQVVVQLYAWIVAKVFAVPILTHVCCLIDCPIMDDGKRHLAIWPEVICFHGRHLYVASFCVFVAAAYVLYVVPFSLVGSNMEVWASSESLAELPRLAEIKASQVNIAFLTPYGFNWCVNQLAQFIVKAILPVICILQNQHNFLRCSLVTALLVAETWVAWSRPAYANPACDLIFFSSKGLVAYISACTIYGGYQADLMQPAPYLLVAIGSGVTVISLIIIIRLIQLRRSDERRPKFQEYNTDNSMLEEYSNEVFTNDMNMA